MSNEPFPTLLNPSGRRPRSSGHSTLHDVAQRAGVSMMTVSRALRGTGQVSDETRERVERAARELSYVPDPAAKALASSKSTSVAVLIPNLTNVVFADLLEAVHSVLQPVGFQPLIGNTHYSLAQEESLLRSFLAFRPAGLLLSGLNHSELTRRLIASSGVPCVHMMELSQEPGVFSVGFSQVEAARTVVDYLLSKGHRKIGFIGASMDARARQRHASYVQTLISAGLFDEELDAFVPDPTSPGLGAKLFKELLACRPDIEAIFFSNDDLAQGALYEALRMGVRIPEDVAIVGFNDVEQSVVSFPRLTTVRTPRSEIGRQSAQMLLNLMQKRVMDTSVIDLGFELILRESA